jgi:hypothetical protein
MIVVVGGPGGKLVTAPLDVKLCGFCVVIR